MKCLLLFACACWLVPAVFADTATFTPAADTTISENSGALADGMTSHMIVGHLDPGHANVPARGLLRFNLSSLPVGIVVTSVTLRVTVINGGFSPTIDTHVLHRVSAPWTETSATWTESGNGPWENLGGDYESTSDASVPIADTGSYTFATSAGLVGTVQTWVTNAAANYGWILRSGAEETGRNARRFTTREAGVDLATLVVGYMAAPVVVQPVTLLNPRIGSGLYMFDFTALPGTSYTVQSKAAVDPGNWTTLETHPNPMGEAIITVQDPLTPTNRFYRVISP